MNEIVIRAERLSKSYKLYDAPRHRLMDILGLGGKAAAGIKQHHALSDVSFTITKGEKVAIIGRNGAGKSTLLKLVTRVIAPSSGVLDVKGETRALLSLGTGFHPEFTGRENVRAYLASLGFAGEPLKAMIEDAIAFAELDDYADQPIKTYSTGMGMRLMFAAATMIKPDLLVVDEVLGVGDAYFQQKSFQHISSICSARQTTLLLVTHDIYNAAALCDRMIWIDRGRLLIDADPSTVVRAYQDSIREQEERRLRAKVLNQGKAEGGANTRRVLVDLQSVGNRSPSAPLHVSRVSLTVGGVQIATAPLGDNAFDGDGTAHLVREGSNWGEAAQFEGRQARQMRDHGSPFHKATVAFDVPLKPRDLSQLGVRIEAWSAAPSPFSVRLHGDGLERDLGALELVEGAWSLSDLTSRPADEDAAPIATEQADTATSGARQISASLNTSGIYGAGDIEVTDLRLMDGKGTERHVFEAGETVTFALDYRIRRRDLNERAQIVLAFKRDGVTDVARLYTDTLTFDGAGQPRGTMVAHCARLPFGIGRYEITVLIAREGYYDENQAVFFSLNPGVYFARSNMSEMIIEGTQQLYSATGAVIDADWSLR